MSWFQNKLPGTFKFGTDFFNAMKNDKSGSSMRKWLAVGCFWAMVGLSFKYTDTTNLTIVLGIYSGLITALVITYTAGNNREQRITKEPNGTTTDTGTEAK